MKITNNEQKSELNDLFGDLINWKIIGCIARISEHEVDTGILALLTISMDGYVGYCTIINDIMIPLKAKKLNDKDIIYIDILKGVYVVGLIK